MSSCTSALFQLACDKDFEPENEVKLYPFIACLWETVNKDFSEMSCCTLDYLYFLQVHVLVPSCEISSDKDTPDGNLAYYVSHWRYTLGLMSKLPSWYLRKNFDLCVYFCLFFSIKFEDDDHMDNAFFASVMDLQLRQFNIFEARLLALLDYNLWIRLTSIKTFSQ